MKKKRKTYGGAAYWATTRDEATTKLITDKSFSHLKEAEVYQIEESEAVHPPGRKYIVAIEALSVGDKPPQFKKK